MIWDSNAVAGGGKVQAKTRGNTKCIITRPDPAPPAVSCQMTVYTKILTPSSVHVSRDDALKRGRGNSITVPGTRNALFQDPTPNLLEWGATQNVPPLPNRWMNLKFITSMRFSN